MTIALKRNGIVFLIALFGVLFFALPLLVDAASPAPGQAVTLNDPLGNKGGLYDFFIKLLQAIIRIGIPIAVLFIVWAGFKFVTAQGKPEELAQARKNLVYTLLGVVIFLAAALIVEIARGTLTQFGLS